ncbi:uncharacterized protein LOC116195981 [Punica granatum]|uniref:Uncharacterized protein LOC116195981 n=2 Tax=Punica granatum TaxID=22663 RepID=A0A6P8CLK4_PUNGR|nr:uncharacterized protein LOC116195981 [Punica granatum]PKI74052.1 hypothetical protein CRG98_005530 [Punica granatum]
MASLISITFSFPLVPWKTPSKEMCPGAPSRAGLAVGRAGDTKAPGLPALRDLTRARFFTNIGCHQDHIEAYTRSRSFCSCMNMESCCSCFVLSGYWVGPDLDDGWGLVEAFVNRL